MESVNRIMSNSGTCIGLGMKNHAGDGVAAWGTKQSAVSIALRVKDIRDSHGGI